MTKMHESKFAPLTNYLMNCNYDEITLSFSQIEDIIRTKLYPSARKYSAYWHPSKTHMLPLAWEEANYEMKDLDMQAERVTLRRKL